MSIRAKGHIPTAGASFATAFRHFLQHKSELKKLTKAEVLVSAQSQQIHPFHKKSQPNATDQTLL
jgi:hypothetical protein